MLAKDMNLATFLSLRPCKDATIWLGNQEDLNAAWKNCENGDWMLWTLIQFPNDELEFEYSEIAKSILGLLSIKTYVSWTTPEEFNYLQVKRENLLRELEDLKGRAILYCLCRNIKTTLFEFFNNNYKVEKEISYIIRSRIPSLDKLGEYILITDKTKIEITINKDGSCWVREPKLVMDGISTIPIIMDDAPQYWPKEAVKNAFEVSKTCMYSRHTNKPCTCTCCQIYAAFKENRGKDESK